jgi:hypothetical protein
MPKNKGKIRISFQHGLSCNINQIQNGKSVQEREVKVSEREKTKALREKSESLCSRRKAKSMLKFSEF